MRLQCYKAPRVRVPQADRGSADAPFAVPGRRRRDGGAVGRDRRVFLAGRADVPVRLQGWRARCGRAAHRPALPARGGVASARDGAAGAARPHPLYRAGPGRRLLHAVLLHEALQGVRIVQSFGMERYEREKFEAEQDRFLATMRKSFFVRAIFTPTLEIMAAVGIAATVVFAARAVASAQLQPERVISFLATIVLLYTPLKSLGGTGQGVTQGMAGARRLWEVLDEPAAPVPGACELPRFDRAVRFEGVSFRYRTQGPLVLPEVDLSLHRGEVLALVGPSGRG